MVSDTQASESRLLALPQELQDNIQEEVFRVSIYVVNEDYRAPALLRALRTQSNQEIFRRAEETFYKTATFEVNEHDVLKMLRSRSPAHTKLFKNVHVHLDEQLPPDARYGLRPLQDPKELKSNTNDAAYNNVIETIHRITDQLGAPTPWHASTTHYDLDRILSLVCKANMSLNLDRALVLAEALDKIHHEIQEADIEICTEALKIKLETQSGHFVWTHVPLTAFRPLLLEAGYDANIVSAELIVDQEAAG